MTVLNVLTVVLCCVYFGMQGVKWFLRKELSKIREELGWKKVDTIVVLNGRLLKVGEDYEEYRGKIYLDTPLVYKNDRVTLIRGQHVLTLDAADEKLDRFIVRPEKAPLLKTVSYVN